MVLDRAEDYETWLEGDGRRAATFEGAFCARGRRHAPLARCVYANGDAYIGPYEQDARTGAGIYIHANGGVYAGTHCKRCGPLYACGNKRA